MSTGFRIDDAKRSMGVSRKELYREAILKGSVPMTQPWYNYNLWAYGAIGQVGHEQHAHGLWFGPEDQSGMLRQVGYIDAQGNWTHNERKIIEARFQRDAAGNYVLDPNTGEKIMEPDPGTYLEVQNLGRLQPHEVVHDAIKGRLDA